MGLWDTIENVFTGGGSDAIDEGYRTANRNLMPYQQGGTNSFNTLNDYSKTFGNNLAPYAHAGDYLYSHINQSPTDYYNNIMSGYSQSPEAKYYQDQAFNASTRGAAASGMLGSGAQLKGLQQNANDIAQRDRQQYYSNVMGANQSQLQALMNLQDQQSQYRNLLQYLSSLGYGASSGMGQNAINQGIARNDIGRQTVGDIASILAYGRNGGNGGLFGGGGAGVPPYIMKDAMAAGA